MELKHIVIMSRSLPFHGNGGMEIISWDLAKTFVNYGIKVTCITTNIENKEEIFEKDNIQVIALKNTKSGKYSKAWFELSKKYFKQNLLKQGIVVLSVSTAAAGLVRDKKIVSSIPIFLQAHGTSLGEIKSKLRTLKLKSIGSSIKNVISFFKDIPIYQNSKYIIAVGDKVFNDLNQFPYYNLVQNDKIKLIRNGIDTSLFCFNSEIRNRLRSKLAIKDNEKVIISASRLHKQKGVHLSLLGFSEYLKINPNSKYIIIGDGPERRYLEKFTVQLGINNKVKFLGDLCREELAKYLNIGDLFLFTTLHDEGLPLNALEALSSGLKVIISNHIEGITKISQEAVIPVDPKSSDSVAKALLTPVDENRSSYLPDEYSLKYCANEYINLFNNIFTKG